MRLFLRLLLLLLLLLLGLQACMLRRLLLPPPLPQPLLGLGLRPRPAGPVAVLASVSASGAAMAVALPVDKPRSVRRKLLSREQAEGQGARVRRSIGRPEMRTLDPFLLLDEAIVIPPAGFPDHPHRGFETVSYMLEGTFSHEDCAGHEGILEAGDLQWMTAGRGILHSEVPMANYNHGLQLWVNLAAKDKMCEPAYQELKAKDIPSAEKDGVTVKVISGESMGVTAKVYTRNPTMFLDVKMQPGAAFLKQAIPEAWNSFVYTLEGMPTIASETAEPTAPHHTCELGPGNSLNVWNKATEPCRFVVLAGQPLNEPVQQYGPFVMTTKEEIMATLRDFQNGWNGFEKAVGWQSKNSRMKSRARGM